MKQIVQFQAGKSFIQNKKAAEAMADRMDITQSDVDKMVSELQTALDNLTLGRWNRHLMNWLH